METEDKKQAEDKRYLVLSSKLADGVSLVNAAIQSKLTIKQATEYLKTRKEIKSIEPEVLSEISHRALEVGLRSMIELAEDCLVPQVRAQVSTALVEIAVKLKQMSLTLDVPSGGGGKSKEEYNPWKFDE